MSFAFAGSMNTGSYFTNLIASDVSYPVDYDVAHLENMEFPAFYGVGQPDDTPPLNERPPLDDGHVAGKEKKRTKNFNVEEDKLNVSQDVIQGVDQAKSTY
jgi:hypothetical protein